MTPNMDWAIFLGLLTASSFSASLFLVSLWETPEAFVFVQEIQYRNSVVSLRF